jgi:hypothetical protein
MNARNSWWRACEIRTPANPAGVPSEQMLRKFNECTLILVVIDKQQEHTRRKAMEKTTLTIFLSKEEKKHLKILALEQEVTVTNLMLSAVKKIMTIGEKAND